MLINDGARLYSASDLVNFLGCRHATFLDLRQLLDPAPRPPDDDMAKLLQDKGIEHERAYLERLRSEGRRVVEITAEGGLVERVARTTAAMRDGAEVIYQGALLTRPWHGYSDFLLRVDGVTSDLGNWAYDVADTKLSRTAKPKHILQLCVYADLVAKVQGISAPRLHVVLGNGEIVSVRTSAVAHYAAIAQRRFEAYVGEPGPTSNGDPCAHCSLCRWSAACEAEWEQADHLSIVAGMTKGQIDCLRAASVHSIGDLAGLASIHRVPGIQPAALVRLTAQAKLQHHARRTGERQVEVLALEHGRGFERLPRPDPGDLFFDMEGDPLFDGGLEYLFGLVCADDGVERFQAFWAHDRAAEKKAFEGTIDFIRDRLARFSHAHVYHYASYEESALKRLAMYHATREADVDDLLRRGKLVDLYKVAKEAIRVSEPRYSIKNLEHFYLEAGRSGAVTTAGDSIVIYERWRRLGNDSLLVDIASYNELDCRSTRMCRDWLLGLRPEGAAWFAGGASSDQDPATDPARTEAEQRAAALIDTLQRSAKPGDEGWRTLLGHLLEFHRREAKPSWWAMFSRQTMSEEELIDDAECIGGLTPA
ncbi:MAG: TM0106 family RecB-like putative nuclease, partial [Caulobacterales bacterium]